MKKIKFSRKYIAILAVAVFLTVLATSIITACYGVFVGVVSGVGLVFVPAPFYLKTIERLGERLEWEKPNLGLRMPLPDYMIQQMTDESYEQLHVEWRDLVDKVVVLESGLP